MKNGCSSELDRRVEEAMRSPLPADDPRISEILDRLMELDGQLYAFTDYREKAAAFAKRLAKHFARPEVAGQAAFVSVLAKHLINQYGPALSVAEYASLAAAVAYLVMDAIKNLSQRPP